MGKKLSQHISIAAPLILLLLNFFIPRNLPEISHNHNHSSSIKEASLFSSFFPLICSVGSQQKFRPHVKVKVSLVPVSQRLTSLSENLIFCLQLKCFSQSPSDSMASTPLTRDTINPKVRFFCWIVIWDCSEIVILFLVFMYHFICVAEMELVVFLVQLYLRLLWVV